MTPPELITGIVTEKGVLTPPFKFTSKLLYDKQS